MSSTGQVRALLRTLSTFRPDLRWYNDFARKTEAFSVVLTDY